MPTHFRHLDTGQDETTEHFFSHQLLQSRIDSGQESNQDFDPLLEEGRSEEWLESNWQDLKNNQLNYEEDVNQYLTLTLADLANPRSLDEINDCLVGIDADVGQRAVETRETRKRYFLYKTNADFLLFHLGLFNAHARQLGDAYFDKGGAYYFSAATNLKGMKGGRSALSDVLEKLSHHFGRYVEILREMRQNADNYLSFHFRLSSVEMESLQRSLTEESRRRNPEPPFSD